MFPKSLAREVEHSIPRCYSFWEASSREYLKPHFRQHEFNLTHGSSVRHACGYEEPLDAQKCSLTFPAFPSAEGVFIQELVCILRATVCFQTLVYKWEGAD